MNIPNLFLYEYVIFILPKHSKCLDPSYKTDLNFWDYLGKEKFHPIAELRLVDVLVVIWYGCPILLPVGKPVQYNCQIEF